ncbi:MAG: outer membrane protein assembly factor BamD [Pseudomonadota bacterium]
MKLSGLFMKKTKILLIMVMFLALVIGSGCGFFKKLWGESGQELDLPPQQLAYDGMENLQAERYTAAITKFQQLKDRYPYSRYAILAELKIADALYLRKDYIEAAEAYKEFERLHPKNEAVPYVIYQQGMCHFNQSNGPERDQVPTVQAIQTFTRLRQIYPDSKFAGMASARLAETQRTLAGHEFLVGQFYFNMEAYKAALGRFLSLIKNYPDTGYHGRALDYIRICRLKIAEKKGKEKAKTYAPERPPEIKVPEGGGPNE